MPRYHHLRTDRSVQLYDVGEQLVRRQLDMLDELLASDSLPSHILSSAIVAKEALAVLQMHTVPPAKPNGPCRESVEEASPTNSGA